VKGNVITKSQVATMFDDLTTPFMCKIYPRESAQQLSYYNLFAKMVQNQAEELKIIIFGILQAGNFNYCYT